MKRFKGNQMSVDYYDFNYDKFVNYICSNLSDIKPTDIIIDCDKYGYDVSILYEYEDADSIASWLAKSSDYKEFIFDAISFSDGTIELSMPIIRANEIAKTFSPKVLKKIEDGLYIGDKKSNIKFWVDVWFNDEDYPSWDWNDMSTSLDDYNDLLLRYFQQIDSVFYDVDGIVSESF